MTTKTTPAAKRVTTRAAKPAAKASKAETLTTEVKEQVGAVVDKARTSSRNVLLAGLGAVAMARKAREQRMNDLVAEGKRFEPKFKKAVDELKAKMQPKEGAKFDLSKFKLDGKKFDFSQFKVDSKKFDRAAIEARVNEGLGNTLHRLGLPTRKEVDALAKKVDKLAELQRA
jgi:poly(hydroxyalkanoate) granule-associated protein